MADATEKKVKIVF